MGSGGSAFARLEEHELEKPRVVEGVLQVDLRHPRELLLNAVGGALAGQTSSQLRETGVRQSVQQTCPVGVMAIDRHGRDAYGLGHPAHGHRFRPLLIQ